MPDNVFFKFTKQDLDQWNAYQEKLKKEIIEIVIGSLILFAVIYMRWI